MNNRPPWELQVKNNMIDTKCTQVEEVAKKKGRGLGNSLNII